MTNSTEKNRKIPFNKPLIIGSEKSYIEDVFARGKLCGDGHYTKECSNLLEQSLQIKKVLLTTSCTHALEMAAMLININEGDEVIMPSYTFVSTANAFVLRGAKIVFVDINPSTMNIDENKIEEAITNKTKAIVPVHYAGVSCEMDTILGVAKEKNICVIEDAAQGVMSKYKGKSLGAIGDLGCYSFHETKNYTMGEGGALCINNDTDIQMAEIIREKGTDRSQFLRGQIDKYTWQRTGSSYLPSDINAAYLYAQIENADIVNKARLEAWYKYYELLTSLMIAEKIALPVVPDDCEHNAHMFYIRVKDIFVRSKLIEYLRDKGIQTAFHYIPLHTSSAGRKYGVFSGKDIYTTRESEKLLRLPMYYGLSLTDVEYVCSYIYEFYNKEKR